MSTLLALHNDDDSGNKELLKLLGGKQKLKEASDWKQALLTAAWRPVEGL